MPAPAPPATVTVFEAPAPPAPRPAPERATTVESAPPQVTGVVQSYEGMSPASGTYRLLWPRPAYPAADEATTPVAELPKGLLVDFKAFYGEFILVEWPGDDGGVKSGWLKTSDPKDSRGKP